MFYYYHYWNSKLTVYWIKPVIFKGKDFRDFSGLCHKCKYLIEKWIKYIYIYSKTRITRTAGNQVNSSGNTVYSRNAGSSKRGYTVLKLFFVTLRNFKHLKFNFLYFNQNHENLNPKKVADDTTYNWIRKVMNVV